LLGFRGPNERQFTILTTAVEKDNKFVPPNAPEVAQTRMTIVDAHRSRISEHRFN
jgi:hypothetical protein